MKPTPTSAFVVAAFCGAAFISSAFAGGHREASGMSSMNATTLGAPTGRSPLGEPVFLVPATSGNSSSAASVGPIGGYVAPRTPMPPLHAPPPLPNIVPFVTASGNPISPHQSTTPKINSKTNDFHARRMEKFEKHLTNGELTSVVSPSNVLPKVSSEKPVVPDNNLVANPFSGSILETGLPKSK